MSRPESGEAVGYGLICLEARYATVRWKGVDRLDRKIVTVDSWRAIAGDLELGWPKGVVDPASTTGRVLIHPDIRPVPVVQFMTEVPIPFEDPANVAATLDDVLRRQPL